MSGNPVRSVIALVGLLLAGGCGNAVVSGTSTALSGFDLEAMAAQMSQSIIADAEVQAALAEEGQLKIVVQPVTNRLRGEVLPLGQARAFTAQVRYLLSQARPDLFTWINNRETFYALRDRELEEVDLGPAPEAIDPNYALTATFTSMKHVDKYGQSAFYVCTFELIDLRDRTVLWTDVYNVKKTAVRNFLD